jgi:hypothetical protein
MERTRWRRAGTLSYAHGFGLEEGLIANGTDCTVLPPIREFPSLSSRSWLYHAPRILAGEHFDQAWVCLTQLDYDPAFLEWVTAVALVRVGLVMESLEFSPAEYRKTPHLLARRDAADRLARAMTHVLTLDEHDAVTLSQRLDMPARWLPSAIPRRMLRPPNAGAYDQPARVADDDGTARPATLLEDAELRDLLDVSPWPERFDALQRSMLAAMTDAPVTRADLDQYVGRLRSVRR